MAKPLRVAALLAALTFALPANAEAADADRPASRTTWYGWQTLLVDGVILGASVATAAAWEDARGWAVPSLVGAYALGAPVLHVAHGNLLRGGASLGLRVLTPLALGASHYALSGGAPTTGHESGDSVAFGILAGGAVAIAIDAALLAWDVKSIAPRVSLTAKGVSAGIGGTF